MADARITQLVVETIPLPPPSIATARVTQVVVETLTSTTVVALLEQVQLLVWGPV